MIRSWRSTLGRALFPAYRSLETTVHPLRYLFLEVTRRCNLACRHCGSDCTRDEQAPELDTAVWLDLLDRVAARFRPKTILLVFTGGEPLVRRDLPTILAHGHRLGFGIGLVSNGFALDAAHLADLRAAGLQSLTVSLDGLAPSHDWLRGRAGSHRRAIGTLAAAARSGLTYLDVVTCVHRDNLGELDAVVEQVRATGVRRHRIFTIAPRGRAANDMALLLTRDERDRLFAWLARRRPELAAAGFHLSLSCEASLPPAVDRLVRDEPYFCRAGINIAGVLADGTIAACPNISPTLAQGSILTDDFAEVWERRFRPHRERGWLRRGRCAACSDFPACLGNSLHLWQDGTAGAAICHRGRFASSL